MEFILPRLQLGRRQGPNVGLDVSSSFSSEVCAAGVADGGLRCLLKQSVCDGLAVTPARARLFCSTNSVQIVCTNFGTIPNFFQMLARAHLVCRISYHYLYYVKHCKKCTINLSFSNCSTRSETSSPYLSLLRK